MDELQKRVEELEHANCELADLLMNLEDRVLAIYVALCDFRVRYETEGEDEPQAQPIEYFNRDNET